MYVLPRAGNPTITDNSGAQSVTITVPKREMLSYDDVVSLRGIGGPVAEREPPGGVHLLKQRLGAGLVERHAAGAQRGEQGWVMVDAEDGHPPFREAQSEWQADSAEADHSE